MSDPKGSAPPTEEPYYASSYQQGSNAAAVAPGPGPATTNDEALAQRLQQEEFRNNVRPQQEQPDYNALCCVYVRVSLDCCSPCGLLHCTSCAPPETL